MSESAQVFGDCKLCGQYGTLRRSHIIPNLAYADVIDKASHPRMVVVRDATEGPISDKTQQTGFWEHLLCQGCETRFSRYETYANNGLLSRKWPPPTKIQDFTVTINGLDYRRLKLFLMSVLWRASVAKGNFFRCLSLGSKHDERLRGMLAREDAGEPEEYGCLISPLLANENLLVERFLPMPFRTRTAGQNSAFLAFRGFAFHYSVSAHQIPDAVQRTFLTKDGSLTMVRMGIDNFPPLRRLVNRAIGAVIREKQLEDEAAKLH